jgi:hypothetical protein
VHRCEPTAAGNGSLAPRQHTKFRVVMFTDGVTEVRSGDEEFGEERLMTLLQCDRSAKPGEVLSCRRLGLGPVVSRVFLAASGVCQALPSRFERFYEIVLPTNLQPAGQILIHIHGLPGLAYDVLDPVSAAPVPGTGTLSYMAARARLTPANLRAGQPNGADAGTRVVAHRGLGKLRLRLPVCL